jgi:prepilin-type N-terminal cleavage/methylation domain-containing protein
MKKNIKNISGFTLIELLIVVAIMGILSTTVVVSTNQNMKISGVSLAAQKISSDIRKVQEYVLGLKEYSSVVAMGGWGLCFTKDNRQYTVFVDNTGTPNNIYDNSNIEVFLLENNYTIKKVMTRSQGAFDYTERDKVYILFIAPELGVVICGNITNPNNAHCKEVEAKITVESVANQSIVKSIIINKFGLVEIQ